MNKAIEQTVQEFEQWRSQPRRGRIPNRLKEQALKLCDKYTDSELSEMLGVSGQSVRNWKASQQPKKQDFITLPSAQTPAPNTEAYTVNLRLSSKVEVIFNDQPLSKIIAFAKAIENQD